MPDPRYQTILSKCNALHILVSLEFDRKLGAQLVQLLSNKKCVVIQVVIERGVAGMFLMGTTELGTATYSTMVQIITPWALTTNLDAFQPITAHHLDASLLAEELKESRKF